MRHLFIYIMFWLPLQAIAVETYYLPNRPTAACGELPERGAAESYSDWYERSGRGHCRKKFAVIHYAAADNNLENFILNDLYEMEQNDSIEFLGKSQMSQTGSSKNMDVLVQIDLRGDTGAYRLHMMPQAASEAAPKRINNIKSLKSPIVETLPETDSGNVMTFQAFLEWATSKYPADHYMVVLGSHGTGFGANVAARKEIKGVGIDDTSHTALSIADIGKTLRLVSQFYLLEEPFSLFVSDACQMQELNVAYTLGGGAKALEAPTVNFVVGSEVNQAKTGLPYRHILHYMNTSLEQSGAINEFDLANMIVQTAYASLEGTEDAGEAKRLTYSQVNVSEMNKNLIPGLQIFFAGLTELMRLDSEKDPFGMHLLKAIQDAESVIKGSDNSYVGHVDLASFVDLVEIALNDYGVELRKSESPSENQTNSVAVLERVLFPIGAATSSSIDHIRQGTSFALSDSIRGENFEEPGKHLLRFSGISIWLAKKASDYKERREEYLQSELAKAVPAYIEFLDAYYERADRYLMRSLGMIE